MMKNLYNPQRLFQNVKFKGSYGRIFNFRLLFWIYANYCTQTQGDRGTFTPC